MPAPYFAAEAGTDALAESYIDDGRDLWTESDTGPVGAVTVEDFLAHGNGTLGDGSQAGARSRPVPPPSVA
ncbi:hypothetical protein, partial [Nocardiopsis sp. NPDC055824]